MNTGRKIPLNDNLVRDLFFDCEERDIGALRARLRRVVDRCFVEPRADKSYDRILKAPAVAKAIGALDEHHAKALALAEGWSGTREARALIGRWSLLHGADRAPSEVDWNDWWQKREAEEDALINDTYVSLMRFCVERNESRWRRQLPPSPEQAELAETALCIVKDKSFSNNHTGSITVPTETEDR